MSKESKEIHNRDGNAEAIKKLGEMIKDIRIAMFTTTHDDGTLHSRPMATQDVEFDGDLWFLTRLDSSKVHDVKQYDHVNLSYASSNGSRYVSVIGSAKVLNDRAKIKELWSPAYKVWFPEGLEDPQLRLIKVDVAEAEYWDTPGGLVAVAIGFVKAVVTGKTPEIGDNETVKLEDAKMA